MLIMMMTIHLDLLKDDGEPPSHALVPSKSRSNYHALHPGKPNLVHIWYGIFVVFGSWGGVSADLVFGRLVYYVYLFGCEVFGIWHSMFYQHRSNYHTLHTGKPNLILIMNLFSIWNTMKSIITNMHIDEYDDFKNTSISSIPYSWSRTGWTTWTWVLMLSLSFAFQLDFLHFLILNIYFGLFPSLLSSCSVFCLSQLQSLLWMEYPLTSEIQMHWSSYLWS